MHPSPTGESIPIHTRSYATEAFAEPDGSMRVHGRITDTKPHGLCLADGTPLVIHDMAVDIYVHSESFEILRVEADMDVRPYEQCTAILEAYQKLVGVSIARGYSRTVKELFGGPGGCSHIGALLIAMGPVAIQASWSLRNLHAEPTGITGNPDDPAERERRLRMNMNTCHVWAEDGVNIAFIKRGERPPSPDWETARLETLAARDDG